MQVEVRWLRDTSWIIEEVYESRRRVLAVEDIAKGTIVDERSMGEECVEGGPAKPLDVMRPRRDGNCVVELRRHKASWVTNKAVRVGEELTKCPVRTYTVHGPNCSLSCGCRVEIGLGSLCRQVEFTLRMPWSLLDGQDVWVVDLPMADSMHALPVHGVVEYQTGELAYIKFAGGGIFGHEMYMIDTAKIDACERALRSDPGLAANVDPLGQMRFACPGNEHLPFTWRAAANHVRPDRGIPYDDDASDDDGWRCVHPAPEQESSVGPQPAPPQPAPKKSGRHGSKPQASLFTTRDKGGSKKARAPRVSLGNVLPAFSIPPNISWMRYGAWTRTLRATRDWQKRTYSTWERNSQLPWTRSRSLKLALRASSFPVGSRIRE